jgi:hypothetical protein
MKMLLALAVSLALIVPASTSFADDVPPLTAADFVGEWKVSGKAGADKKRLAKIESTLSGENILVRNLADDKLDKVSKISDYVTIAVDGNGLIIKTARHDYSGPIDGSKFKGKTKGSDETLKITRKLVGRKLVETVHSEGGVRTNTFTLGDDLTTLTWSTKLKSKKLEKALKFSVKYKK